VTPKPTPGELEILRVLWTRGASTVREVNDEIPGAGYTTTLKLMQIMAAKGLVERDERSRAHVYRAVLDREATERGLVNDLLDRAFGGSAAQLVMRALSTHRASPAELAEIRRMLDEAER
jgi:predicted transcriptional regulator